MHNFGVGDLVKIKENDLELTRIRHSCHPRMYDIRGYVFEVVRVGPTTVSIRDGDHRFAFHPDDVDHINKEEFENLKKPIFFNLDNLHKRKE